MQNRLTIKDIARMSGVGKSTVSRVLNNEGSVSPQTRERVEAVIRQQGFTPSKSARAMRGQSDKVVAIMVSRLDSPSENQAVRTMLPLFYQQGYDPILMESQFDPALVSEHLHVLQQRHVDGVILFGFSGLTAEMLSPWQEKMVVLAREYPGFSSVCYDDDGAVRLLMDKLRQAGHRHISYIGVQPSDATTGMRRHQSYLDYSQQHGLVATVALGELSYQSGFQLAPQVIKPDTSALVCASDTIAMGVSKYLQQQGQQHIQVCGIGNTPLLHFLFPNTLSVELGYGSAGEKAALQLLDQLNRSQSIQQIIIPGQLT
ncbi:trehalose operon repressor TreR [Yersinia pekkanenii]|uniref:HTH-type transcriptional regulator TreR n=1 Tax=Yersinia pekkanenii TaxID=1288385 RepID=A0A0T9PKI4_9GAMM|nr:trehalose operon repressor TreR [Yersinia pekkanenii]CNH69974.1 trehalose repressor [Yersinia pekkanenii]CRY68166.1 trehalose repressor [Yersinia pekkanenii]